ncbi:Arogenate dehydratase/prephenate dehydratase 6 [Hibiscus syriacus]|uniref:Arogenate dehydratase n=1 Tax=Hibiscus syriacus TaxID=106335 RepID=A0A6A2XG64_HIBSY|nr:Arogenate dehydratase/prephenate dehydratase 6 [Hibiscus syriacus]
MYKDSRLFNNERSYPHMSNAQTVDLKDNNNPLITKCEYTLTKMGLSREAIDDTALAAKASLDLSIEITALSGSVQVTKTEPHVVSEKLKDTGAFASSTAAKTYGLNILAEDIQDDCDNVTRFLMLARELIIPGVEKPFKTSIVVALEDVPGVLFKALSVFALRQINLTKIESRPLGNQPFRLSDDSNASMAEKRAQNALRHLHEFATSLRVLGSYPVDTTCYEQVCVRELYQVIKGWPYLSGQLNRKTMESKSKLTLRKDQMSDPVLSACLMVAYFCGFFYNTPIFFSMFPFFFFSNSSSESSV